LFQIFDFLFELPHRFQQLGELGKRGNGAQPDVGREGGRAGYARACRHVVADSTLRVYDGVVVDGEVAGDADLTRQQHMFFEDAASGESNLRADDVVFADNGGVAYLHEGIDLGASLDACLADCGAIDSGERLDLDVVFDHGDAGLDDLVMRTVGALG